MADKIKELQAEIARLKAVNGELVKKYEPSLRTRVCIKELMDNAEEYVGRHIGVAGWIRTVRKGGGGAFCFIKLYDGTTGLELQIILDEGAPGFDAIMKSTNGIGTSLFCLGEIVSSKGSEQSVEMKATEVRVVGECSATAYPLAGKGLSLEYLRTVQHMRPRTVALGAVTRVRNCLAYATHNYFQGSGFQYVHTPLITASDCEGGGEMFQVTTAIKDGQFVSKLPNGTVDYTKDFFKRPAFLTVSGQLNAEIYATALSSVYTFGPTFRAEDSHTSRHLSEFWMIEPEIAFADIHEDMDVAEGFLKFVIRAALDRCPHDMKILEDFEEKQQTEREAAAKAEAKAQAARQAEKLKNMSAEEKAEFAAKEKKKKEAAKRLKQIAEEKAKAAGTSGDKKVEKPSWRAVPLRQRLKTIVDASFARVTYTEAIGILQKAQEEGVVFEEADIHWGIDLASEHERYLCEVHFQKPTIVINYPKEIKAFYMRVNEDGKTVAAMDILVPGVGEIIGGSQREERADVLEHRMKEMGLEPEAYSWYLDLRRFGSVPHAGFGAGFERVVCYTTGIDNIRDAIPFPRYPGHADY